MISVDKIEIVSMQEELSGIGAAYMAGLAMGIWDERIFEQITRKCYDVCMATENAKRKYAGWRRAVNSVIIEETKTEENHGKIQYS